MATTTVLDNGLSEILSFKVGPVAVGSYSLTITPLSDTGITGTPITQSVTVGGAPAIPTALAYVSGTVAATIVSFLASVTPSATYRFYWPQEVGGPTYIEEPAATHAAGSGTLTQTLPALAVAAGDATVFITSVLNGFESPYAKLTITYDSAGNRAAFAPNAPSISFQTPPVDGGRNIEVTYFYDSAGQSAVPTKIQTRIVNETGTVTTQTEVDIGSLAGNGINISGNLTIASGANGWFRVAARTKSAAGNYSAWSDYGIPVWCSNVVIGAPTNLVVNTVG